jgi:tRNA (guanine-N7-)-methyltransferase
MNIENDDTSAPGAEDNEAGDHDLRSYGRRRGRKLSDRQARLMTGLLPRLKLDLAHQAPGDLLSIFAPPAREIWLEIGFGGGEHLLWQAQANPEVGLIGCEPFEDGVVKVLTAIETQHITNVRLWPDDARAVLRWLPAASVTRVFVLFPDPWPKRRHQKRRLLSAATMALIARVLKPGGELRIGTDIADYTRTIFMAVAGTPALRWKAACARDWRRRPADWPETRYEQKAIREGRPCCYLRFERIAEPPHP